jgi:hypothetical protein
VGRNRSIAACAFVLAMAFGCGQAWALDLNAPATQLTTATGLPALPQLPTVPEILPTPAPAASTPAEPTPAESVAPTNDSSPVATGSRFSSPVVSAEPTFHTASTTASSARNRGVNLAGSGSRTRQARRSHRSGRTAKGQALPTYEQSRFDRLGKALDLSSPAQFFGEFSGAGSSAGMSWAVPLLSLMLPIGLCGILATVRQRRPSTGIDGRSSRLGK